VAKFLRERKEDILLLANFFITKFADLERKIISGFSAEVIRAMENYQWPGNVRELENLMHRSVLLTKGPIISELSQSRTSEIKCFRKKTEEYCRK